MPQLRLTLSEAKSPLPPVCMACGKEAQVVVQKEMAYIPNWRWIIVLAGPLALIIAAMIAKKCAILRAPMCRAHRNYWTNRTLFLVLSFFALLMVIYVYIQSAAAPEPVKFVGTPWLVTFALFTFLCSFAWITALVCVWRSAIRPLSISDLVIVLLNVAPEFIDPVVQLDVYQGGEKSGPPATVRERRTNFHMQADRPNSARDAIQS
jgi:hypothetical protein